MSLESAEGAAMVELAGEIWRTAFATSIAMQYHNAKGTQPKEATISVRVAAKVGDIAVEAWQQAFSK